MKKSLIVIVIATVIIICVGILFNFYFVANEMILIPVVGALITMAIGFFNHQIAHDNLFKELFHSFNEKYDNKFNKRLNELVENESNYNAVADKALIVDYLNFCAEEYLWYTKDRIDEIVWLSWQEGMKYYINKDFVRKIALEEIRNNNNSYYNFFNNQFPKLLKEAALKK